jgi:D-tyrosyl-tRNA(Tyr) deacylase
MRALIQRVSQASVAIGGNIAAEIDCGFLVLLGIEEADTMEDGEWLAGKIARLRVFSDADGKMNADIAEAGGRVLVVSQFTLHANTKKGNRPSFIRAARPETAVPLYERFLSQLESVLGAPVEHAPAPRVIDVGPKWITALMKNAEAVRAVKPDLARMPVFEKKVDGTGIVIFGRHANGGPAAIEVRAFAPSDGVPEDPVCGSGNGCVAVFIRDAGLSDSIGRSYTASQGFCVGRDGRIAVDIATDGAVKLGGHCVTVVDGSIAA